MAKKLTPKKKKTIIICAVLAVLVIAGVLFAVLRGDEKLQVETVTASKQTIDETLDTTGKVNAASEETFTLPQGVKILSLNVKEGDVVSICMPNTPEAIYLFYAVSKIGAVANMIHPLSSENEFKELINKVNAKIILILDTFYEKLEKENERIEIEKFSASQQAVFRSMHQMLHMAYNLLSMTCCLY